MIGIKNSYLSIQKSKGTLNKWSNGETRWCPLSSMGSIGKVRSHKTSPTPSFKMTARAVVFLMMIPTWHFKQPIEYF
jgi:hypothetical protein